MKKFAFLPCTHQKIFINLRVFRPQLATLLVREVRELTGIHFDCFLDGGFFFEVLRLWIEYLRNFLLVFDFIIGTVPIGLALLDLFGDSWTPSFDLVRLLGPWHSQRFNYSGLPYRIEKRDKSRRKLTPLTSSPGKMALSRVQMVEKIVLFPIASLWIIFQFNVYRTTILSKSFIFPLFQPKSMNFQEIRAPLGSNSSFLKITGFYDFLSRGAYY